MINKDIPHTNHSHCDKVTFASKKFADEHIARIMKKSDRDKVPVRSYKCLKCGKWHLTSRESTEFKPYEDKIKELEKQVVKLLAENKSLKAKKEPKEFLKNTDNHIQNLKKKNKGLTQTISRMRKDRNELINTIVKLEKRLKNEQQNTIVKT